MYLIVAISFTVPVSIYLVGFYVFYLYYIYEAPARPSRMRMVISRVIDKCSIQLMIAVGTILAICVLFNCLLDMHTIEMLFFRGSAIDTPFDCDPNDSDFLRLTEDICQKRNLDLKRAHRPDCSCPPRYLKCRQDIKMTLQLVTLEEIVSAHPLVQYGGIYEPPCNPIQKVAIIIPVRNRDSHLAVLLNHLHPMLQRQMIRYHVFVAEQSANGTFNKGLIMNVGFMEAKARYGPFDCYIFHDVDMLAEDDRNIYSCTKNVRHIGSNVNKFAYKLIYEGLFGGVIAMSEDQFRDVNGFSNKYVGWGGEDDDMYRRVRSRKFPVDRYESIGYYYMLKHDRDIGNPSNHKADVWRQLASSDYAKDGVNTLDYRVIKAGKLPLFTRLFINVQTKGKPG